MRHEPVRNIFDMITLADEKFKRRGIFRQDCRDLEIFLLDRLAVHRLKFAGFGNTQVLKVGFFSFHALRDSGDPCIAELTADQTAGHAL